MADSKQTIDEQLEEQQSEEQQSEAQQPESPGATAPGAQPCEPVEATHSDGDASAIEGDLDELVAVGAQRDEYLALAQRTQADFENYRKRVARESALAQERGVTKLAKELLPALDNLDRALEAAAHDDPLLDGVRLVRSELSASLARVGVKSFSPLGETFDPALHEAMATVPAAADGGAESGTVVEVYQPGYRLGESIIRPARVVVAA
ncbi:MAG TPA: nucleotide exchange factor GrpE [Solirubrobacteraceae bacterium]|nr:nucleotide exchange factor GrpE [Solirubrobacteraceae bacterium]